MMSNMIDKKKIAVLMLILAFCLLLITQNRSKENYCIQLAKNLDSSNFESEVGGILVDFRNQSDTYYNTYFKPVNREILYTIRVPPTMFNNTRGKFYKWDSSHFDGKLMVKPLIEVPECMNDEDYLEFRREQPDFKQDYFCDSDDDCLIKEHEPDCFRSSHKDDPTEYEFLSGPRSHTVCPSPKYLVTYCKQGGCFVKYDCSKCDSLEERMGYCDNYTGALSLAVCGMYRKCNC